LKDPVFSFTSLLVMFFFLYSYPLEGTRVLFSGRNQSFLLSAKDSVWGVRRTVVLVKSIDSALGFSLHEEQTPSVPGDIINLARSSFVFFQDAVFPALADLLLPTFLLTQRKVVIPPTKEGTEHHGEPP